MIDERLERMKRKHNCRVHFDADSFQISDCIVSIYPAKVDGIIYIVSSIPVSKDSIKENIQKILHALEAYGFPKLKNPKSSITLNI